MPRPKKTDAVNASAPTRAQKPAEIPAPTPRDASETGVAKELEAQRAEKRAPKRPEKVEKRYFVNTQFTSRYSTYEIAKKAATAAELSSAKAKLDQRVRVRKRRDGFDVVVKVPQLVEVTK